MKFSKRKHEVQHQGRNYPVYHHRFGPARLESSIPEKDLRVVVDNLIVRKPVAWHCDKEAQQHPGLHEKERCQPVEGGDPCLLLSLHETYQE